MPPLFLSSGWQTCKPVVARDLVNGGTAAKRWWDERSEGLHVCQPEDIISYEKKMQ